MTNHEQGPLYTVVDIDEYEENMENRVRVEDMIGSDEVFVFYGSVHKIGNVAIRAHVSVNIETFEANAIRASGSLSFRDIDFSPAKPNYEYSGIFHARFFIPGSVNPIIVKPGFVIKRPIEQGFLVREDEGYDEELHAAVALPSLDRDSELVH